MANSVYQYEQPRCPDNWNEAERRFYNRLIQVLDDIYAKYGRIDDRMVAKTVQKIEQLTDVTLDNLEAGTISAGTVLTDALSATYAHLASLSGKYGSFDFETVKNLVAQAMVLQQGQADYIHITNLAATYAQMVNAVIGNLVIQDGENYYELAVSPDGTVRAELAELTEGEKVDKVTSAGRPIVATSGSFGVLDAETVSASFGLINKILAEFIDVDKLVARDAFIEVLTASQAFLNELSVKTIYGDKSIRMLVEDQDNMSKWFTFDNKKGLITQKPAWTDKDGKTYPASIWQTIVDEIGFHIFRNDMAEAVGSFYKDRLKTNGVQLGRLVTREIEPGLVACYADE